jgi:anthranilate synthase component I
MYTPDFAAFSKCAEQGNLVPVSRTIISDTLTPVGAFALLDHFEHGFLLESVVGGERIARYSFVGCDPFLIFKATGDTVSITRHGKQEEYPCHNPWDEFEKLFGQYKEVKRSDLPPFIGGAVGYSGYDSIRHIEKLPDHERPATPCPDSYYCFYNTIIAFDHITKSIHIIALADLTEDKPQPAYSKACERIDFMIEQLAAPQSARIRDVVVGGEASLDYTSNFSKKEFEAAVDTCKEYILAGDIFQVVLSQRLSTHTEKKAFDIYRVLRVVNPSPYMFFVKNPDVQLIGASPEVMVRLEDERITLRPIAGTRPRGANAHEDKELAADLLADPKEIAEHVMLLDLGRNDVGRVSAFNSVEIEDKMIIEYYSHVMHIVSSVNGRLKEGLSPMDVMKACLPAGTVSGAPKIRAMEIIEELEPDRRGPYAGAVGYFDFSGNFDTCIAIRTIVMHDKMATVQAGAGIVADSVPANEYQETLNKARAMLRAIELA